MNPARRHPWARSINFEGCHLPATMYAVDHLGKEPEISEETSVWLWHFTICSGCKRTDDSERILRCAKEAFAYLTSSRKQVLINISPRFDGPFDEQVVDEWLTGLSHIIRIAERQPACSWIA